MEHIQKMFFDPLITERAEIELLLLGLPVGSAHPFLGYEILVHLSAGEISSYYMTFHNGVPSLDLNRRYNELKMFLNLHPKLRPWEFREFRGYKIEQPRLSSFGEAPAFSVPLLPGKIHVFALGVYDENHPNIGNLCAKTGQVPTGPTGSSVANQTLFPGITHDGPHFLPLPGTDSWLMQEGFYLGPEMDQCTYEFFVLGYHLPYRAPYMFNGLDHFLILVDYARKVLYFVPAPCILMVTRHPIENTLLCSIRIPPTLDIPNPPLGQAVIIASPQAASLDGLYAGTLYSRYSSCTRNRCLRLGAPMLHLIISHKSKSR